jgi:D-amino-acid dehydrogenase
MSRAVIVGGGIIGGACAYYLSNSGWKVTIIDRGEFGKGCSHANCGFVCPSHVLPLATPGAVKNALKAMLSRNSPFSIKPRLDFALWCWLWRFARRCNSTDMMRSGKAIQALLNSSRALYDDWMRDEPLECEWQTRGLLFVFRSPALMEHYAATDRLLREHFAMPAKRYVGEAVNRLEPALKPGMAGGWLYESDAHLRPDKLMTSLRRLLANRGVAIREHCEMLGVSHSRKRATALITSDGEVGGDAFVVAAGAWTPLLNKVLGCRVPIQPGKGYSITMSRPAICPTYPLIFEEHRVAITPMQSGYRIGSTMEFAGYDATLNRERLSLLHGGASHYLEMPSTLQVREEWFGWRPMTTDSVPIIGPVPTAKNVWLAAGHNMLGLSMAPGTGKLIAELLNGEKPHVDPALYSLRRFK